MSYDEKFQGEDDFKVNIKEIPVLDDQERLIGDLTLVDILTLCSEEFLNNESR
ncbi:MAG: hypothetical protein U9N63_05675 [Pseudomonadota bacterium]|nr:hypothetical protein [Pseudomonadota bacterium]